MHLYQDTRIQEDDLIAYNMTYLHTRWPTCIHDSLLAYKNTYLHISHVEIGIQWTWKRLAFRLLEPA